VGSVSLGIGMLQLSGWKVAMTDTKRLPFDVKFVSLGVMVDFTSASDKEIVVTNKPGRLEGVQQLILEVLRKGFMGFKQALSIKDKITYAEGQLFSKVAAPTCRVLSKWASVGFERELTDEMKFALSAGCEALMGAGTKRITRMSRDKPVLVFTDGACEADGTTIGGVMFDGDSVPELFGGRIAEKTIKSWCTKLDQKQVIGQAELFPFLIARHEWAKKLRDGRVIYFIDNDAARLGMIKAYSPVLPSLEIISSCLIWDHHNSSVSWYARAPTASNIADDPSRLCPDLLVNKYGARVVAPLFPDMYVFSDILQGGHIGPEKHDNRRPPQK
jgi:hypothetical protein